MRISDWSSDVCSSDLESADMVGERGGDLLPPTGQLDEQHLQIGTGNDATGIFIGSGGILQGDNDVVERDDPFVTQHDCPDRKSVVEGKSVSVRVDLGGRRIIKQKKKNKNKYK